MVRPPYLPDVWDNDADMKGLMSLPKAKHVNPTNYKRVIEFWKKIITDYCKYEQTCLFSIEELKVKLRRGSQLPSPLALVLQEMQEANRVQRQADYEKRNQGWLHWGFSFIQPTSWFAGSSSQSNATVNGETFVELTALDHLANNLLRFYRDEYELADCPEVVDYAQLKANSAGLIDPRCFDLVVSRLVELGEVGIGKSKRGDKILKFKDQSSKGPAQFTDTDASVHELRTTMCRIEVELKRLEERMLKLQEDAREVYRRGDKKSALGLMRKKKRVEEEIAGKDRQYQNLLQMLQQLAQSKQTKEIMDIYRESSNTFKAVLQRQGLTAENVDMTLENVNDVMNDIHEVEDALRHGLDNLPSAHGHETLDESQLESELNELIAESATEEGVAAALPSAVASDGDASGLAATNKVRIGKRVLDLMADFPTVPDLIPDNTTAPASGNGSTNGQRTASAAVGSPANGDTLEARWKRLRAE